MFRTSALRAVCVFVLGALFSMSAAFADPPRGQDLILWLDASDLAGVGQASSALAAGAPVEKWLDKSAYGNHAEQPIAELRPEFDSGKSPQGGVASVRFSAACKQFLKIENRPSLACKEMTVFVVATAQANGPNMWLLSKNGFDPCWTDYGVAVEGSTAFPWPHLGLGRTGTAANGYVRFATDIRHDLALVELRYDGKSLRGALNGRWFSQPLSGPIETGDGDLLIGASPQALPATEFLEGNIAELLVYNRALSDAEQEQAREYLAQKYGLKLTNEEQAPQMRIIDNGYLPVTAENPATPQTRTLCAEEADAALRRDWLFQADGRLSFERVQDEIAWARQLSARLERSAERPDFSKERAELSVLEEKLLSTSATQSACLPTSSEAILSGDLLTEVERLYFAVRGVKRQIAIRNPAVDFDSVLFIDQPYPAGPEWRHEAVHRMGHRAVPGGRLLTLEGLSPGGKVRQLAPGEPGSFWRPELSFDGNKVLFCFKPYGDRSFHLFEINLDGTELRQLTDSKYDDIDPIYLPDGHIMFTTTRGNSYVRCGPYIYSYVLARCDADGANVYLISTNSEPDFVPALLGDGRVAYSRWEYSDKDQNRVQSLWTTNQDGTGTALLWGNQSVWPDHQAEPRPIPGSGRVMFTGVGHHDWFIGSIGIIDPKKGSNFPYGLTRVTWDLPWAEVQNSPADRPESPQYHASGQYSGYLGAYPISQEDFLVSARGSGDKFRLYLMDVYGNRELIYEGEYNAWYAQPVKARPRPPSHPDLVAWPGTGADRKPNEPGVLYSANVYEGVPELPRDSVKYLRVFQQDAKTQSTWKKIFVYSGPSVSAVQTEAVKRIVSVVPVEADGSVNFEAPTGQSLFFQLLDENYRALHTMRSFTGLMPGEKRGCVGCHRLHSTAPPRSGLALRRSPTPISPPPWGEESIGYERFVQPVLDRYCGDCHQGDGKARKKFDMTLRRASGEFEKHIFKEPYLTMIGPAAWPIAVPDTGQGGYGIACAIPVYGLKPDDVYPIDPATDAPSTIHRSLRPMRYLSARSPLIERASSGKHHDVKVDPVSLHRLIAWVDANCPYQGEEEFLAMDDPVFPGVDLLPVRPQVKSAPLIARP